jgi:hypothetical protein
MIGRKKERKKEGRKERTSERMRSAGEKEGRTE